MSLESLKYKLQRKLRNLKAKLTKKIRELVEEYLPGPPVKTEFTEAVEQREWYDFMLAECCGTERYGGNTVHWTEKRAEHKQMWPAVYVDERW